MSYKDMTLDGRPVFVARQVKQGGDSDELPSIPSGEEYAPARPRPCATCRHHKIQSFGLGSSSWSAPACTHPKVAQAVPIRARSSTGDCGPEGAFHEADKVATRES